MDFVTEIKDENFDDILKEERAVLVDFWAPWCGPCKAISPLIEDLGACYSNNVKFCKMNVDENPETAGKLGIRAIPTVVVFREGEIEDFFVGVRPKKDLEDSLKKII